MVILAHDTEQLQRTDDIKISENVVFDTMFLTEKTLKGLRNSGFYKPSPIQLNGIPLGKCGFDLLLEAKSGTGKTAVFTIIALEKIDLGQGLQTIILAPTREIAAQICDVIKQIGSFYEGLNVEVVMGGLPVQDDIKKFEKNVHIVVGSPGRLKHLIQENHIDVSSVRLLILDEADKLMEKAFQTDIRDIFTILPRQKQVVMSSATYTEISKKFIRRYVQNAQHICPENNSVLLGVSQYVTTVKYNSNIVRLTQNRFDELHEILNKKEFKQCLIFCNYQARVAELFKMLTRSKWPVEQLYGQQEQQIRLDALKTLQEYKCRILVSTDLAARGIDASNVDLVIHFEPPFDWQTYLHRIGRAGRFGSYGTAISILSDGKELQTFREILSLIKFPIILKDFWTDKLFDFDHCKSETTVLVEKKIKQAAVTNTIPSNECENIWNMLTSECLIETDEVQSFEKITHSFNKSEDMAPHSFSDLLHSFQNNEYESNKPPINCSIPKYDECNIKPLSEVENELHNKLNSHSSNNINICTELQIDAPNHVTEEICEASFDSKLRQMKIIDNDLISSPVSQTNLSDCNNILETTWPKNPIRGEEVKVIKEFQSNNDKDHSVFRAPKYKEDKQENKVKYKRHRKIHDHEHKQSYEDCRTKLRSENKDQTIKKKQNKVVENVHRTDNLSVNCNLNYPSRHENQECSTHMLNRQGNGSSLTMNNTGYVNSPKSNVNYSAWYNQLKNQMASFELALYYDELSKNYYSN